MNITNINNQYAMEAYCIPEHAIFYDIRAHERSAVYAFSHKRRQGSSYSGRHRYEVQVQRKPLLHMVGIMLTRYIAWLQSFGYTIRYAVRCEGVGMRSEQIIPERRNSIAVLKNRIAWATPDCPSQGSTQAHYNVDPIGHPYTSTSATMPVGHLLQKAPRQVSQL